MSFRTGRSDLINSGAISFDRSRFDGGLITTSYCLGTRTLYDYVDKNPIFEFYPIARLGNPLLIRRIKRLVSIMNVIRIDISGESVIFHSGDIFLSGYESKLNFVAAAAFSKNGKAIVALNSVIKTAKVISSSGMVIIMTPTCKLGAIRYIVTEYGVANLLANLSGRG